jgi:hypothetical protein
MLKKRIENHLNPTKAHVKSALNGTKKMLKGEGLIAPPVCPPQTMHAHSPSSQHMKTIPPTTSLKMRYQVLLNQPQQRLTASQARAQVKIHLAESHQELLRNGLVKKGRS